jgi:hypothetical protein
MATACPDRDSRGRPGASSRSGAGCCNWRWACKGQACVRTRFVCSEALSECRPRPRLRELHCSEPVCTDAMAHVCGYCIALDMTARDWQSKAKEKGKPWTAAKGFDTALPVGSFIPKALVKDPMDLTLWCKVALPRARASGECACHGTERSAARIGERRGSAAREHGGHVVQCLAAGAPAR